MQLLLEMQVTLQCVGAVWGCVMAGTIIQSLGIFPLQWYKYASRLKH